MLDESIKKCWNYIPLDGEPSIICNRQLLESLLSMLVDQTSNRTRVSLSLY